MSSFYRLDPFVRHKLWGGRILTREFGAAPDGMPVGEVLDASALPAMPSRIVGGPEHGRPLSEVIPDFPLLVKRIDAASPLSVQVHPDDAVAQRLEGQVNGKSEAWVVLAAEPGAALHLGLRPTVRKEDVDRCFGTPDLMALLRRMPVKPGDAIPVPAGCIHAIGAGLLLFEVQQPSDTTYRLWDHGRESTADRPLHRSQSAAALRVDLRPEPTRPTTVTSTAQGSAELLLDEGPFRLERIRVSGSFRHALALHSVVQVIGGAVRFTAGRGAADLTAGGTLVVAEAGAFDFAAGAGEVLVAAPGQRAPNTRP